MLLLLTIKSQLFTIICKSLSFLSKEELLNSSFCCVLDKSERTPILSLGL